jgi:uncharacterized protein (TIGR02266 family)
MRIRLRYTDVHAFIDRYARNISRGGMFVQSRSPQDVGTQLDFELALKDGTVLLRGSGKVIWTREYDPAHPRQAHGMGVRFTELDKASQKLLDRIIATRDRGGGLTVTQTSEVHALKNNLEVATEETPEITNGVDQTEITDRSSPPAFDSESPAASGEFAELDGDGDKSTVTRLPPLESIVPPRITALIETSENVLVLLMKEAGLKEARVADARRWALRCAKQRHVNGESFLSELLASPVPAETLDIEAAVARMRASHGGPPPPGVRPISTPLPPQRELAAKQGPSVVAEAGSARGSSAEKAPKASVEHEPAPRPTLPRATPRLPVLAQDPFASLPSVVDAPDGKPPSEIPTAVPPSRIPTIPGASLDSRPSSSPPRLRLPFIARRDDSDREKAEDKVDNGIEPDTGIDIEPDTDIGREPDTDVGREPDTDVGREPDTDVGREPDTDVGREPDTDVTSDSDDDPDLGPDEGSDTELDVGADTNVEVDVERYADADASPEEAIDAPSDEPEQVLSFEADEPDSLQPEPALPSFSAEVPIDSVDDLNGTAPNDYPDASNAALSVDTGAGRARECDADPAALGFDAPPIAMGAMTDEVEVPHHELIDTNHSDLLFDDDGVDTTEAPIEPLATIMAEEPADTPATGTAMLQPDALQEAPTVAGDLSILDDAARRVNELPTSHSAGVDDTGFDLSEVSSPGASSPSFAGGAPVDPADASGVEIEAAPPGHETLGRSVFTTEEDIPNDWVDETDTSVTLEEDAELLDDDVMELDDAEILIEEPARTTAPPPAPFDEEPVPYEVDSSTLSTIERNGSGPESTFSSHGGTESASHGFGGESTLVESSEIDDIEAPGGHSSDIHFIYSQTPHSEFEPAEKGENTTVDQLDPNSSTETTAPNALGHFGQTNEQVFEQLGAQQEESSSHPQPPALGTGQALDEQVRTTDVDAMPAGRAAAQDGTPSLDDLVELTDEQHHALEEQDSPQQGGKQRRKRQTSGIFRRLFGKK